LLGARVQRYLAVVVALWTVTVLAFGQSKEAPTPRALANNAPAYVKLRHIKLGNQSATITNFILKRDGGTFVFRSGAFYFLEAVDDKITGAVFVGDGSFFLTPPIEIERRNLALLTGGRQFEEQFRTAVFRFTDSAEQEIRQAATGEKALNATEAETALRAVQQDLREELRENLAARLLEDVMSSEPGGKFTAFVKGRRYSDKIVFDVDPHGSGEASPEEVTLYLWDDKHLGLWAAFHLASEYQQGSANSNEQNTTVRILHQKLETTIARNASLAGKAETTFRALRDGVRVVPFDLYFTLRVRSVTGENGEPLFFIQEDQSEDADFAVILPRELKKDETYTVTTIYAGKDAVRNEGGGNYYPVARDDWYPGQGFGSYATYEMIFRIPKGMTMVATGTPVSRYDEGNENVSRWTTEVPQSVAGFNFGRFQSTAGQPLQRKYTLEVYANVDAPELVREAQRSSVAATLGSMSTLGLMKKALGESQLAIDIFTDFFGELPYRRLAVTQQTATDYGQSWPGLVYLPITYFFDSTVRHQLGMEDAHGYFKVVGPHEVAHQWWGHLVGFNSYRDQWMSEGFSDMAAALFLQYIYRQHGLNEYHQFWADQRQTLLRRNEEGKRPIDVGPVTLGTRLSNARSGFDTYRCLIYPKGAYILQMVRFMLRQPSGDPDARFKALLHEFTRTFANRQASTEDFKAMLEKYMTPEMDLEHNHKMDWFFAEYVYGTEYPSYRFRHSFSRDRDGNLVLNFKLTQGNVSERFVMLIPIYVDMGHGQVVRVGSARMAGNRTLEARVTLKDLKGKPRRAVAAYYDDVLGSFENK
jgi:Peptidase family M1 domain